MGSGSLAAMGVFEDGWKPDMTLEEGKKLVRDAIAAGVFNDLGLYLHPSTTIHNTFSLHYGLVFFL